MDKLPHLGPVQDSHPAAAVRVFGMLDGIKVKVTTKDRTRLEAVVADRNSPQKHVWRARIILLTACRAGVENTWSVRPRGKHLPPLLDDQIQDGSANRRYPMRPLRRPPHPLLLGHPGVGDLVDATFCPECEMGSLDR